MLPPSCSHSLRRRPRWHGRLVPTPKNLLLVVALRARPHSASQAQSVVECLLTLHSISPPQPSPVHPVSTTPLPSTPCPTSPHPIPFDLVLSCTFSRTCGLCPEQVLPNLLILVETSHLTYCSTYHISSCLKVSTSSLALLSTLGGKSSPVRAFFLRRCRRRTSILPTRIILTKCTLAF